MTINTKNVWRVLSALIFMLLCVAWWYSNQMSKPLYQPGAMRNEQLLPPPQQGDSSYWNMAGDIQLFHFSEGNGTKILTLHGGPGIPWEKPVSGFSLLTDQYQIHYYDQRGCGRSSRPFDRFNDADYFQNMTSLESKLGIRAQLEDIERTRQILGEEKIILMGHSFGALLAALYAAEYPERIKALILIAPADLLKMPSAHGDLFWTIQNSLPPEMKPEYDAWQKEYFDFAGVFKKSEKELQLLNQEFSRYYAEAVKAEGLKMPEMAFSPDLIGGWGTYALYFSLGKRHDYRAAMEAVKSPVLVIHGAEDLQSAAASKGFAAAFSNAQFLSLAGAGHFPFVEKPEAFAAAVRRFLDEKVKS